MRAPAAPCPLPRAPHVLAGAPHSRVSSGAPPCRPPRRPPQEGHKGEAAAGQHFNICRVSAAPRAQGLALPRRSLPRRRGPAVGRAGQGLHSVSLLASALTISGAGAYDNVGGGPAPAVGAGAEAGSLVRRPRHRQQPRTAPRRPLLQVTPAPTPRCLGGPARPGVAPRRPASDRTLGLFLSARRNVWPRRRALRCPAPRRAAPRLHCLGKQTGKGAPPGPSIKPQPITQPSNTLTNRRSSTPKRRNA